MQQLTVSQAVDEALAEEMRLDPRVLMFGEGVATKRQALLQEFGAARVRNTPLAEGIIAGTAAGAAATGLRPVIDLLFAPFLTFAMDELVNSAGTSSPMTRPMSMRTSWRPGRGAIRSSCMHGGCSKPVC